MCKLIMLFLICTQLIYPLNIVSNREKERKLFYEWLNTRLEINENKENLTIEVYEKAKETPNIYSQINYQNKIFYISLVEVGDLKTQGEVKIFFNSPWEKIPYLWVENKKVKINGWDFLENRELGEVLALYLENEQKSTFSKKIILNSSKKSEKVDISMFTNALLLFLGLGVIVLLIVIIKSIKNRYGDPFRR